MKKSIFKVGQKITFNFSLISCFPTDELSKGTITNITEFIPVSSFHDGGFQIEVTLNPNINGIINRIVCDEDKLLNSISILK
jgi:hypothetical protein